MSSGYGEFDPKFPGVSLNVDSAAGWQRVLRYALGTDLPDLGAASSDQDFLDAVSSVSTLVHESRHFHDILISDYGVRLLRYRLMVVLNMLEVLAAFRKLGNWRDANVVLTPLSEWCRLTPEERQEQIASISLQDPPEFRPPELPYFTEDWTPPNRATAGSRVRSLDALGEQLRVCGYYQQRIRQLHTKPPDLAKTPFDPRQFAEASAVLAQLAEIAGAWDPATAERFLSVLLRGRNRYGSALTAVREVFPDGAVDATLLAGVLCWSMFGSHAGGNGAYAMTRFARLGRVLLTRPARVLPASGPASPEQWHRLFARWDELTGLPPTMAGLRDSVSEGEDFFARVRSRLEAAGRAGVYGELLDGFSQVLRARAHMVDRFIEDPGAYIDPAAYRRNAERWTAAPLKVTAAANSALTLTAADEATWAVYAAHDAPDGRRPVHVMAAHHPLLGVRHIDPEATFTFYSLTSAADILIGPAADDSSPLDRELTEQLIDLPTVPILR
ncbi:hypothetical protein [Actinacidiphila sp. ITFR-21]|uniref:hypothetical protein n=1 Tax=Actinacidiphila sp. ITFR-21 TaxID=3075199 RepID=UPI00288B31AF|nr:hypothetical protein [Streptomyces sp. ITFR-21]WNI14753.1 hypothetical protein RLT57_03840 [Streptomyces sp. ITFR-21]